jgi:hypothetical protein
VGQGVHESGVVVMGLLWWRLAIQRILVASGLLGGLNTYMRSVPAV